MAAAANNRRLTIIHTNDFHNRLGADKIASITKRFRETSAPKLLLDAGDAGGSSNITFRPSGEPILSDMTQIGYQAMTVGNRDFHVSRVGFRSKVRCAGFPILCANIRPSRTRDGIETPYDGEYPLATSSAVDEPIIRAYSVYDVEGWRVVVVGLTVPMVTPRMWERKVSSYVFDPPIRTAIQLMPVLRARFNPDLLIALTHIGLRLDRELAMSVPEIDVIIGGHSHEVLPQGEWAAGTLIVQAGSHGRHIGVIDVDRGQESAGDITLSARIEPL